MAKHPSHFSACTAQFREVLRSAPVRGVRIAPCYGGGAILSFAVGNVEVEEEYFTSPRELEREVQRCITS